MDMGKSVARLVEQFQPEHYELHLVPNRDKMTFSGTVAVRGKKVGRPAKRLTFHQNELKISNATVVKHDKKGDQDIVVSRINNQDPLNEVRLHSDSLIYPGSYTVVMEFSGVITKPMNGIYPCDFKHDGQDKKLIATQFESHHAREAFPCIDEPEAKATFDLTLTTPAGEPVLANTPAIKEVPDGDLVTTTFATTPSMSVYLLAFVYGEMGFREAKTKDDVIIRAYATPDNVALTQHGLDDAVKILEFFSDYFGVLYPLPKLDMVALPDFAVGAMENWGLMTFREQCMLVDPKHGSIESKQLVSTVVAHEISHQWFGDLVTMKWWDDLWLNESFANLMEYCAVDAIHPEWSIWEQFVSHESVSAKRRDSIADVQSVRTGVNHPDEINTIFDPSIVYAKGGSLLYMLMNYIGEEAFRAGLEAYFKKHAYGNTIADDLWVTLSASSGQDIGAFMQKWLTHPGYPLIDIDWQPGSKQAALSQKRFLADPTAKNEDTSPWHVPLSATSKLSQPSLTTSHATVEVSQPDDTLIFNHDGQSYYLPHYQQAEHLGQIVQAVKDGEVSTIDRHLLLDNYTMLQRGGVSSTTELLDLLTAYEHEASETVWGAIAASLAEARRLVEGHEASETKLDQLIERLVIDLATSLGWDDKPDDSAQTLRLRGTAIALAAGSKNQATIQEGLKRFATFTKPSDLSASTRGTVYFCAARYGTDADFTKLLDIHNSWQNADEKEEIAGGLTSTKNPDHIEKLLQLMMSDEIRRQDLLHWFVWMMRNRYSREATWNWMVKNWDWIVEAMASDKTFSYFVRYCGNIFSTQEDFAKFREFFEPKKSIVALGREITLATQEITSRIAWRERNEADVKAWLKAL